MKELPSPHLSPLATTAPLLGAVLTRSTVWLLEPFSVSAPRAYLYLGNLAQTLRSTPPPPQGGLISGGVLSAVCNNVMSYLFSGVNILYCM